MLIVNLTQHLATPEQKLAGVEDLPASYRKDLLDLITFEHLPTRAEINRRAVEVAYLARHFGAEYALIGGAPFFMSALEDSLKRAGIRPLYAFSRRESVEETLPDGSVKKVQVFRHAGFIHI